MTIIAYRIASCLTIALALLATPSAARAQEDREPLNIATLTATLDSADLSARAVAVAALATVAPANLPVATRRKLVALLEREATSPRPSRDDDGEDGELGPYLTQLARAVVRLNEPSSARGLALLGIATSADAQQFVASRGDAAVTLLDEAERADTNNRGPVAETRGRMLGDYPTLLSPSSRLTVRAALLRLAPVDPLAFAHAAEFGRLVEAVPLLALLASSSTDEFDRSTLAGIVKELTALRTKTTPEFILDGLTESIAALCDGAQGSRLGACQSMTKTATNALDDLRAGRPAVQDLVHALATVADNAQRRGAITPLEGAMVSGTAIYLATRI